MPNPYEGKTNVTDAAVRQEKRREELEFLRIARARIEQSAKLPRPFDNAEEIVIDMFVALSIEHGTMTFTKVIQFMEDIRNVKDSVINGEATQTLSSPQMSAENLDDLLFEIGRMKGINYAELWKSSRKDATHLLAEINAGETELVTDLEHKMLRSTRVLNIGITYTDSQGKTWKLHEDRQEWKTKMDEQGHPRVDRRGLTHVSEKITIKNIDDQGRPTRQLIVDTLAAELGLSSEQVASITLHMDQQPDALTYADAVTGRPEPSASYPGLLTRYSVYPTTFKLPEQAYVDSGYVELGKEKNTFFVWKLAE